MDSAAAAPRATPLGLDAVPTAPDRRRHALSGGGLYLTWKQAALVLGVLATSLTLLKGVWPVVVAVATIPATVERSNAAIAKVAGVVERLERESSGLQLGQASLQREQAQLVGRVEQLSGRVGTLEPIVASHEAIGGERTRQFNALEGRVGDVERALRSGRAGDAAAAAGAAGSGAPMAASAPWAVAAHPATR